MRVPLLRLSLVIAVLAGACAAAPDETSPPGVEISLPDDVAVLADGPVGARVDYSVSARGADSERVEVRCDPASGTLFPIGQTEVQCSVADGDDVAAEGEFRVDVGEPAGAFTGVVDIAFGRDASDLGAEARHSCAAFRDGSVACTGDNSRGGLGTGTTEHSSSLRTVVGLTDAVDIAVGASHSCAVLMSGSVHCWGGADLGQLGVTSMTDWWVPKPVPGVRDAIAVVAGLDHSCALLSDETVQCWGANDYGQLGNGESEAFGAPTVVSGLVDVVQLEAGDAHTCARRGDGTVACWGAGSAGQLGDARSVDWFVPVAVAGVSTAVDLDVDRNSSCVVLGTGAARCWGGRARAAEPVPMALDALGQVVEIEQGPILCVLDAAGDVSCDTGVAGEVAAVELPVGVTATGLVGGADTVCAILSDGAPSCWSHNRDGEAGVGHTDAVRWAPMEAVSATDG